MCISNLGNRRPYPGASALAANSQVSSLLNGNNSNNAMIAALRAKTLAPPSPTSTVDQANVNMAKSSAKTHITVQHNYHDHSNDSRADYREEHPARGGVTMPFPLKLHDMLDAVAAQGMEDIVSWQPHGRCFLVHKPKEFVNLLPQYFKLSKIASFQRQLNLYGFQRLTRGRDRGGYYHELFLRNKVFLSHSIQRIKVKGTGVRARSNPDQEPDFWSMPWVGTSTAAVPVTATSADAGDDQACTSMPLTLPLEQQAQSSPVASLPEPIVSTDDDFLDVFDDVNAFECLDPFQPAGGAGTWTVGAKEDDVLSSTDADAFFDDFDFPSELGKDVEDDELFGSLLEQMLE